MLENSKEDKPTVKAKVRNFFVLHLIRGKKRTIYQKNEIVWLTPAEAKKHQHLIEIIN